MSDDLDPLKCRSLALLWRGKAASAAEGDRDVMLRVALEYEKLADSLEAALGSRPFAPDGPLQPANDSEP